MNGDRDRERPYNPWRRAPPWARQFARIVEHLQEIIMATKEEVRADLTEIKNEVAETRGAANSAIALLRALIERIATAAATATDLDEFRAELALIRGEVQATEDELKAAVTAGGGTS